MIEAVMGKLKGDDRTLRQIAEASGIQTTRVHRLKMGKEPKAKEIVALAGLYQVTAQNFIDQSISEMSMTKAEEMVANKYGITLGALQWRVTNPTGAKA